MTDLAHTVDEAAQEAAFTGVVHVGEDGRELLTATYGQADRAFGVRMDRATRLAIASGSKSFTAVVVAALVEAGVLGFDTRARDLLGEDLPDIDDAVTVRQLMNHRSGIGDYFGESEVEILDYAMTVPVHALATTEDYLPVLAGHPTVFRPGTSFEYCNGGFVVLALLAERAAATPFHDLVTRYVTEPAGMSATGYDRSDELDGGAARHYLFDEGLRTNVLHLPVRGSGDGGAYSTVDDIQRFWSALLDDQLLSPQMRAELWAPASDVPRMSAHYGMGFWLRPAKHVVFMEGYDAGVSFRSMLQTERNLRVTVMANCTDGAWPVVSRLESLLDL